MREPKILVDPAAIPPQSSYKVLIGSVVPRPIGFISTISPAGVYNLAPFSFFNAICGNPPVVCFACGTRSPEKDTLANVRANGEFVVNIVSEEFAEQMNLTSGEYPAEVDEFQVSGLTPMPSNLVRPPHVAESHVNMECKLIQIVEVSTRTPLGGTLVIGEVIQFHVDPEVMNNYRIDAEKLRAIGRMGGNDYARTRDRFSMVRP
ncbi:MAG TPA: flavin reductase family protein [Bryobacteraceae bacterium]|nr:flavin reductase family protein [Bryobacteraceae bacterium]